MKNYPKRIVHVVAFLVSVVLVFQSGPWGSGNGQLCASPFYLEVEVAGDIDGNLRVDLKDLALVSGFWLGPNCSDPLWCDGADLDQSQRVDMGDLVVLGRNWLTIHPGYFSVPQDHPTRLAMASEETICVSNSHTGTVLLYDSAMATAGEISGLDRPLGVAADSAGRIYVGNNGRDNVEVYNSLGVKLFNIGDGEILMPVDLCLDRQDNLYVADSLSDHVKVYDPCGVWLFNIGQTGSDVGQFIAPSAVKVVYREIAPGDEVAELYVADQGNFRIQVFDLAGNFQRTFGKIIGMRSWRWEVWTGKFIKLQSLDFDALGRLHVVDCYMNKIQILDPDSGTYIDSYGSYGVSAGLLNLPLDVLITPAGQILVANHENHRLEVFGTSGAQGASAGAPGLPLDTLIGPPTEVGTDTTGDQEVETICEAY